MLKESEREILDAFTIDSDGTKLREDAISFISDANTHEKTLVVSVPDVYGYIQRSFRGSAKQPDDIYMRDRFNYRKATEQLNFSEGRKKIPALSFFITFNEDTHALGLHMAPTLLNITHNYSYTEAATKLNEPGSDIPSFIAACNSLVHYPKPYVERTPQRGEFSSVATAVQYLIQQVSLLAPLLKKDDGDFHQLIYEDPSSSTYSKKRVDHPDNRSPRTPVTSPLRRLADFVNVISLSAELHGQPIPFNVQKQFKAFAEKGVFTPAEIPRIIASHPANQLADEDNEGLRLIAGIVAAGPRKPAIRPAKDSTLHYSRDFAAQAIDALLHNNRWKLEVKTEQKQDKNRYKTILKIVAEDKTVVAMGTGINTNRREAGRDAELHCLMGYRLSEMIKETPKEDAVLIDKLSRARGAIQNGKRVDFERFLAETDSMLQQSDMLETRTQLEAQIIVPYRTSTNRAVPPLG